MIPDYITHPQAQGDRAHHFMVELASRELELDRWGEAVPKDYTTLDCLVPENSEQAVRDMLWHNGLLEKWQVISIWQPNKEPMPF